MRALMVDPGPDRERASPVGEWEADDEVGVDQVVRAGLHIELGEHARSHAHLPLVRMPTRQHDILAESDARNLPGDDRRRDPQPRGEEMRLFRIGDQGGECARALLRVEGCHEQDSDTEEKCGAAAFHVPKLTSAPFPLRMLLPAQLVMGRPWMTSCTRLSSSNELTDWDDVQELARKGAQVVPIGVLVISRGVGAAARLADD